MCPFCKEEIKVDAFKCKHCGSSVVPEKPTHSGICHYCLEEINKDAIKCKHCGSDLLHKSDSGCGCTENKLLPETIPNVLGGGTKARQKLPGIFNSSNFPLEATRENCVYKLACVGTPWGSYCWLQKCCFSDATGTWGCIDL